MIKLIRKNQKNFLAGLTILSMITFVVSYRGNPTDHSAKDRVYATVSGKPMYLSEVTEARGELSALKNFLDFKDQPTDEEGQLRNPQAAFMHEVIMRCSAHPDFFALLRHEANAAGVQVSNDDIEGVMTNYATIHDPNSDDYLPIRAGVTDLLKIIARYEQVASMLKISKPQADFFMVAEAENIQLDLLQLNAADFAGKVPAPTPQEMQAQFAKFSDTPAHQPNPTTNPFGFGYRLPMRAKLQFIRLSPDAVNEATVATKSAYEWEVQARKYYLSHLDEFPTTAPTAAGATAAPVGSQPFKAVQDNILAQIREPLNTALMDQVQRMITSTLSSDWQAYSQFVTSGNAGPEPASSLGVPYTSFDYLTKLADKVKSKFKVTIGVSQTTDDLSQEQIAALPGFGTSIIAETAIAQASDYLKAVDKKDPTAPAQLVRASSPMSGSDDTSAVIFRLAEALPSGPAPSLQSVAAQVETDLRTAAAYKLAEAQAKLIVSNIKDRPLLLAATPHTPIIHIDHLSMGNRDIPEIKPPLGDSQQSFTTQAFALLNAYDPVKNRNPAAVIGLPEQARVFPAALLSLDSVWNNSDSFFVDTLQIRRQSLQGELNSAKMAWFDYDSVVKRTDFKPTKNGG